MKKETLCVHSGTIQHDKTGGINTPIYTSSAFEYLDKNDVTYPRYFNTPNQKAVVEKLCALEQAEDGVLFSSGMAAISTTILTFARSGEHVVLMDELYGGTHTFATDQLQRFGVDYTFVPAHIESVCNAVQDNTRIIMIESPTNPLLGIIDIRKVAEFAKNHHLVTIIDNTFATPINQNPLNLGIDIVVHSGTKYLGGHSDICCGVSLTSREKANCIRSLARHLGGSLNATTCYLLERSIKTLAIRVERQTENARRIADFMDKLPMIKKVNYPGLPDHEGYKIAKDQMNGFGAMLSFEIDNEKINADQFVKNLRLIKTAVSLGGIDTTICSPAVTSHAKIPPVVRRRIGIADSLLRLSVGIEHVDDILEDIIRSLTP